MMTSSLTNSTRPAVQEHNGILVVRDDLHLGGTKARCLSVFFREGVSEYVYASPVQGYAQVALAHCCHRVGYKATVFCAARRDRHQRTLEAGAAGANIQEVRPGYLSVVKARAADYCRQTGAAMIPWGCDHSAFIEALADVARSLDTDPTEVWCATGSGVLTRALQIAWPWAIHYAVRVGAEPNAGQAEVLVAPESFDQDAKGPLPPFPSCSNYDAKVWRFILAHASRGALFWNVAG